MNKSMVYITTEHQRMVGRQRAQIKRDAIEELDKKANTNDKSRLGAKDRTWRRKVIERDGSLCVECGSNVRLQAHHFISVQQAPKLRYEVANGMCLCIYCHAKKHPKISNWMLSAPMSRADYLKSIMKYQAKKVKAVLPDHEERVIQRD